MWEKSPWKKREEKQIIGRQVSPKPVALESPKIPETSQKQISCLNASAYTLPAPSSDTPEPIQKQTCLWKERDTFPGGIYNGQIDLSRASWIDMRRCCEANETSMWAVERQKKNLLAHESGEYSVSSSNIELEVRTMFLSLSWIRNQCLNPHKRPRQLLFVLSLTFW